MKKRKRTTKKVPEQIRREPVTRCQADIRSGLSTAQVQEYARCGWTNAPVEPPLKTVPEIIRSNLFTYFNLVFAVLAVLLIVVGSFRSLTFLPVVLANLLIGTVQEVRANKTLGKLSMLHAPKVLAVRDGKVGTVPAEKLVLDDIVLFSAGNQICADAIVVDGEVSVNESLLTGEPDEIVKKPGDVLMSGSFVVSGECCARLDKVGADSYISKLTLEAKAMNHGEQSEMLRILDKLVGVVGIVIIPIGVLLFVQQFFFAQAAFDSSVVSMVAAVIGMIPEGLYLLASVALAVSVVRLASKKVLVHDMKCIETLARVDVLCVDKTGTITENTMQVNSVVPLEEGGPAAALRLNTLISDLVKSMPADNITMQAMKEYFHKPSVRKVVSVIPFSSVYKYCGAIFANGAYVLGAPEFVLREDYENYQEQVEAHSAEGYRVLVFGAYNGRPDGKKLTNKVTPLGLILLSNPIRKEAPKTFQYFAEQGVEIKVISGDNPVTVSQVAAQAGIANAENYIDASTLRTEDEIRDAVLRYTVFGRSKEAVCPGAEKSGAHGRDDRRRRQ